MKKVLIFMLLISLLLTGCNKAAPIESGEAEHSTVSTETKDAEQSSLPSEATTSSLQPVQKETQPEESIEETAPVQITQPHTEKVERTADNESETEPATMDKQTEAETLPATEASQSTEPQETKQPEEAASETESQPTEGEPESSFQPVTESEPETTEVTEVTEKTEESTEPPEPFDIGAWVSFAQSYAQSIGLNLDSAAVDCWDNPITAGAHCIYLERDICSRLDRYNRDEDITDVWIWAVEIGNGCYDLYIGYA